MRKRIIKLFVIMCLMLTAIPSVAADSIYLNGGEYVTVEGVTVPKSTEFSVWKYLPENTKIKVTYDVVSAETGTYALKVFSSKLKVAHRSPYRYSINGGEEIEAAGEIIGNDNGKDAEYNLGIVKLKKGVNKVDFICDKACGQGRYSFALIYMNFEPIKEWYVHSIKGDKPCNIWEENGNVSFTVNLSKSDIEDHNCYFKVTDYYGNVVEENDFKIRKRKEDTKLSLGKYDTGWYKLEVGEKGGKSITQPFAVVPKRSGGDYSSPIMYDVFNVYANYSDKKLDEILRAAKLGGADIIRERLIMDIAGAEKGKYDWKMFDASFKAAGRNGLEILPIISGLPTGMSYNSSMLPEVSKDLFDVYDYVKMAAERYDDVTYGWEYLNEVDLSSGPGTADVYAAQLKAAAIAVDEADTDAYCIMSSMGLYPTATKSYYDVLMQNDISPYTDFFNYHRYGELGGNVEMNNMPTENIDSMINLFHAHDTQMKEVWVTEASSPAKEGASGMKADNLIQPEARTNVIQTVTHLARGEDKHVFFSFPYHQEASTVFGMFDNNWMPYPVYTAIAVLSDNIGKGKIKGEISNLSENAYGYLFDNGKGDTAVIWADGTAEIKLKSDKSVTVSDVMGVKRTVKPQNGVVSLAANYDPLYVIFDGNCDEENYYLSEYGERTVQHAQLSDTQKVVIRPRVDAENWESSIVSGFLAGYTFEPGETKKAELEIYNFNNKVMKGKIAAEAESGYTVTPEVTEITLNPKSKAVVEVNITANEDVTPNITKGIKFYGDFGEEDKTSAVAAVIYNAKQVEPCDYTFQGFADPANYDSNQASGQLIAKKSEDGKSIEYSMDGAGSWWFPYFKVKDIDKFGDYDGVSVTVHADKTYQQGRVYLFAYYDDREVTKFCMSVDEQITEGYTQFKFPWDNMARFSGPVPIMNLKDVKYLGFGFSGSCDDEMEFTVTDFGLYNEKENDIESGISVEGVEEGGKLRSGSTEITVKIPEDDDIAVEDTRIILMGTDREYTITGKNTISVDLKDLKKGSYRLLIAVYTQSGKSIRKQICFYVD